MTHRRKVVYVSGTRADFGLMQSTLKLIHASTSMELSLVVTGMHLDDRFGATVQEIEAASLDVVARIRLDLSRSDGASTARNIGAMLVGFVDALAGVRPDMVIVLGDRGEMLAAAIAAGHMSIPVVHIHGGERSGTIDEPVRHAISKLSHVHLVATDDSRQRLIRMGEDPWRIHVVGAPGLDGLVELANRSRSEVFSDLALDENRELALLLYHPVLQEADRAAEQVEAILEALLSEGVGILALKPNSDPGSADVLAVLERYASMSQIRLVTHLARDQFATLLRHADVMVGNSSSGIIEAGSFGTPVLNIGSRQNQRQRNSNVIDCVADRSAILAGLQRARKAGRMEAANVYGDGRAGSRIVRILEELDLSGPLLNKVNAY